MSFAYDIIDGGEGKLDDEWCFELRKLKLYEVSVVPIGANQETEVTSVKSFDDAEKKESTGRNNYINSRLLILEKE